MRGVLCLVCLLFIAEVSSAQDKCSNQVKNVPIKSIVASAGAYANLRNKPGSVSYESTAIFQMAKDQAASIKTPDNFCTAKNCSMSKDVAVVFHSAPEKVLTDSSDSSYCKDLEKQTTAQPLRYSSSNLQNIDDLNNWIGDLSQGKGQNGGDLYKKCDRSCSPRYEYHIAKNNGANTYTVNAVVICGAPRDKSSNNYLLDAFFQWTCESKAK